MLADRNINPTQAAITFFKNYDNFKFIFDSFFDKIAKDIAKENDKAVRKDLVHQLRVCHKTWEMMFNGHEEEVKRAIASKTPNELQQLLIEAYEEVKKGRDF